MTDETTRTALRTGDSGPILDGEMAHLVVAFEQTRPLGAGLRVSLAGVDALLIGRGAVRAILRGDGAGVGLLLADQELSRQHARLCRTTDGWEIHDLGSKNGTLVNGAPATRAPLSDGDLIEIGTTMLLFFEDAPGPSSGDKNLETPAEGLLPFRSLVPAVERRAAELSRIAASAVPVLIWGETGSGKELVARAIHQLSGRRGAFVPVNCGALPRELIESELFGHRRGAFSGARDDHEGLVRRADGGTLFLDEIAELPEASQVALLRVLQEGEVRAVGATDAITVDVRVVAATHQDLRSRLAAGRFRHDLYSRLAGFETSLVPLRERRADLGTIIAALLTKLQAGSGDLTQLTFQQDAARKLFQYEYPFNVRELEQALRSAAVLADGGEIRIEHLPAAIRDHVPAEASPLRPEDRALRERLIEVLRESGGNVMATGRALGKAPIQVRRWCRRFGIDLAAFRR